MPYGNVYKETLRDVSVSTAITLVQLKAGTVGGALILEWAWTQRSDTTSRFQRVQLVRKTAAATVTAAVLGTDLTDENMTGVTASAVLSTSGTGNTATAEGTDGQEIDDTMINVLNVPFIHTYTPFVDAPFIQASGIIGVKLPVAPAQADNMDAHIKFMELG